MDSLNEIYLPNEKFSPEQRLVCSVIIQAINDILIYYNCSKNHPDRIYRSDAIGWVYSSSIQPFSLYWCCEVLKIDYLSTKRFMIDLDHRLKNGKIKKQTIRNLIFSIGLDVLHDKTFFED